MDKIDAVFFEPVGCLAEFRAEPFDAASHALFGASPGDPAQGSQAYWRLLGLIEARHGDVDAASWSRLAQFEMAAVATAELYEDVRPALEELHRTGTAAFLVSSLSRQAVRAFVERFSLADLFVGSFTRDEAGGVMAHTLRHVLATATLDPRGIITLVDTAAALSLAKQQGLNAILMINDYDEARDLATSGPTGGIVSLAELPDALRVIAQRAGIRPTPPRAPIAPFELFDPEV